MSSAMHSDAFDVIPYEVSLADSLLAGHLAYEDPFLQDIKGDWKKLGSGSFGNVYKGASIYYASLLIST
jgi:LIM domain kinase 1